MSRRSLVVIAGLGAAAVAVGGWYGSLWWTDLCELERLERLCTGDAALWPAAARELAASPTSRTIDRLLAVIRADVQTEAPRLGRATTFDFSVSMRAAYALWCFPDGLGQRLRRIHDDAGVDNDPELRLRSVLRAAMARSEAVFKALAESGAEPPAGRRGPSSTLISS